MKWLLSDLTSQINGLRSIPLFSHQLARAETADSKEVSVATEIIESGDLFYFLDINGR